MHELTPAAQAQANQAIEQYLNLWSDAEAGKAISAHHGFATWQLVQQLYSQATGQSVDWSTETLETAAAKVAVFLRQTYPWLSENSIGKLTNSFAYAWK